MPRRRVFDDSPPTYRLLALVYDVRTLAYGRVSEINLERGTTTFKCSVSGRSRTVLWRFVRRKTSKRMQHVKLSKRRMYAPLPGQPPRLKARVRAEQSAATTLYEHLPYPMQARVLKVAQQTKLSVEQVIREMGL